MGTDNGAWVEGHFGVGEVKKPSTNEKPRINERRADGGRFGMGDGCPCGGVMVTSGWKADRGHLGVGEAVRAAGWWSTDSVTDSRTGTEGGHYGAGEAVRAAEWW